MDINQDSIVTGSADHGLRIYNVRDGKYRRELHAKQYGHAEWVSTCAFTSDGRIVSGGMDNKICVWAKSAVRCDTLMGHKASISKVLVDDTNTCLSASYDCVINVWDLDRLDNGAQLIGPHKNAVLEMAWKNSLVVSGDKDGVVVFWVGQSDAGHKQRKVYQESAGP
jgi:WD40 repeat protein